MQAFGAKEVQRLAGITASSLRSSIRAGHVKPNKGRRGALQFSFQDLIVLRAAQSLARAKIPARRINRSIERLRKDLPSDIPLSGLSIVAIGAEIVVREGNEHRDAESGQYLLAFDIDATGPTLNVIDRSSAPALLDAVDIYADACELELQDATRAIAAYRKCIESDPMHLEARINCGRLLHLGGLLDEAEKMYRAAEQPDAILLFNLAVLLEDLGRQDEAIAAYREVLALDPGFADAHFNLARLHELAGNHRDSLRHLLAYRKLNIG